MKKSKITVIGSLNMDIVTTTDTYPLQGETVRGTDFQTITGGKGANQAVAAARLGAEVKMIGCVGNDSFGEKLRENLQKENINAQYVKIIKDTPSGLANIILSEQDNRIIFISGANSFVTPSYIEEVKEAIYDSDYVIIQFEIPKETIEYCLKLCDDRNIPVIVNPAPAMHLADEYWEKATYITPNETEWQQLFQQQKNNHLIITRGKEGVLFMESGIEKKVASHKVEVRDTTGAGDTFNGALAVALSEGMRLGESIRFANAAAALSIQKIGAQAGMPPRKEVLQFLK